ncbi:hypothetical protein CsSME_00024101 [Camellia sinensis var. sinensis]
MASLSSSLMKPISQTSNTSLNFTDHSPNSLLLPKILSFSRLGFRGRSLPVVPLVDWHFDDSQEYTVGTLDIK